MVKYLAFYNDLLLIDAVYDLRINDDDFEYDADKIKNCESGSLEYNDDPNNILVKDASGQIIGRVEDKQTIEKIVKYHNESCKVSLNIEILNGDHHDIVIQLGFFKLIRECSEEESHHEKVILINTNYPSKGGKTRQDYYDKVSINDEVSVTVQPASNKLIVFRTTIQEPLGEINEEVSKRLLALNYDKKQYRAVISSFTEIEPGVKTAVVDINTSNQPWLTYEEYSKRYTVGSYDEDDEDQEEFDFDDLSEEELEEYKTDEGILALTEKIIGNSYKRCNVLYDDSSNTIDVIIYSDTIEEEIRNSYHIPSARDDVLELRDSITSLSLTMRSTIFMMGRSDNVRITLTSISKSEGVVLVAENGIVTYSKIA